MDGSAGLLGWDALAFAFVCFFFFHFISFSLFCGYVVWRSSKRNTSSNNTSTYAGLQWINGFLTADFDSMVHCDMECIRQKYQEALPTGHWNWSGCPYSYVLRIILSCPSPMVRVFPFVSLFRTIAVSPVAQRHFEPHILGDNAEFGVCFSVNYCCPEKGFNQGTHFLRDL